MFCFFFSFPLFRHKFSIRNSFLFFLEKRSSDHRMTDSIVEVSLESSESDFDSSLPSLGQQSRQSHSFVHKATGFFSSVSDDDFGDQKTTDFPTERDQYPSFDLNQPHSSLSSHSLPYSSSTPMEKSSRDPTWFRQNFGFLSHSPLRELPQWYSYYCLIALVVVSILDQAG